jgi:hypothetical protein
MCLKPCGRDVSNVGAKLSVRSTGIGPENSQLGLPHGARRTIISCFRLSKQFEIIRKVHDLYLRAWVHHDENIGRFQCKIEAVFVGSQRLWSVQYMCTICLPLCQNSYSSLMFSIAIDYG